MPAWQLRLARTSIVGVDAAIDYVNASALLYRCEHASRLCGGLALAFSVATPGAIMLWPVECSALWAALEPVQILGVSRRGLRTLRLPLVEPGKDQNARGVRGRTCRVGTM